MSDLFIVGDTVPHITDKRPVKIMAIKDGYVMARRPHCKSFVAKVSDIERWIEDLNEPTTME